MFNVRKIQLLLLVAAWLISGATSNTGAPAHKKCRLEGPCVNLRHDYTNVPGIGAYKLHTEAADWDTARNTCRRENGYLAVPNSEAEVKAIIKVFEKGGAPKGTTDSFDALIGFHDQYAQGEFVTIFDKPLAQSGYSKFAPGEPNNLGGGERCGAIRKNGLLNDISCTGKFLYICELALCGSCRSY